MSKKRRNKISRIERERRERQSDGSHGVEYKEFDGRIIKAVPGKVRGVDGYRLEEL